MRCRLLLVLSAIVAISCTPPREAPEDGKAVVEEALAAHRAARFRAGSATPLDAAWTPWFARIPELDGATRCSEGMCFVGGRQRILWDLESLAPVADPGLLRADEEAGGILPILVDFADQLRSRGIDLLLLPVPPRAAVYPELWDPASCPLGPEERPPLLDDLLRSVYADLEEHGVEVVDLLPAFLDARRILVDSAEGPRVQTVFRALDYHWSPWGTEVTARVLAERIRDFPWFAEASEGMGRPHLVVRRTWRQESARVRGILPSVRKKRGEREWLWTLEATVEGEEWNFDDPDSPVLLVGDSFTQPDHGLRAALLVALGFRIDRITVPGGLAPTLLQAVRLAGEDRLAGKRLVILELDSHSFLQAGRWYPVDVLGGDEAENDDSPPSSPERLAEPSPD